MAEPAYEYNPPPEYGLVEAKNFTMWFYPERNKPEWYRWQLYEIAKAVRYEQEWAEVPILEDFEVMCNRVARDLEL